MRLFAAEWGTGEVFWSMLWFFLFFIWIWLLIIVFSDIFRSHDLSGWVKAIWIIFVILVPYLGVFVYLIAENDGMTKRNLARSRKERHQFDEYVRETAGSGGGAAAEIERAKGLLDSGVITQEEFDVLKANALA